MSLRRLRTCPHLSHGEQCLLKTLGNAEEKPLGSIWRGGGHYMARFRFAEAGEQAEVWGPRRQSCAEAEADRDAAGYVDVRVSVSDFSPLAALKVAGFDELGFGGVS